MARGFLPLFLVCQSAGAQDTGFADELRDDGVAATASPRSARAGYGSPTPTSIPGARVVTTLELARMLEAPDRPAVVVAYAAAGVIGGAVVMDGAGEERLFAAERDRFERAMAALTGGDKSKAVVFYCHGPRCWLSYNASLHAIASGYSNVYWYRGGRDAWREAKLKFGKPAATW